MIAVVGEPRSGTSLQMLILKNLGLSIVGVKYINEHTKTFNPTGIWEDPNVMDRGFRYPFYNEDAIKLSVKGLIGTRLSLVDKIILCIRDPREVIVSMRQQTDPKPDKFNLQYHIVHMAMLIDKELNKPMVVVDYGDVMFDHEKEIKRIAEFVEVEPTQAAFDCIRPDLYRSKKHKVKRCKLMKAAEKYYQYLRYYIREGEYGNNL